MQHDVLIVGAGPTGLVLALWLTKQGVSVRIIDKTAEPGTTSRAMAVQARTLELYRQLDIADAVVAAGHQNPALNMWAKGKRAARIELADAGAGLTPYPFVLVYPQDRHERLLVERLEALGVKVERRTELAGLDERADGITATLRASDGTQTTCEARYIAGCDGARSFVRHAIGAGFEGGTYDHVFYVADVTAHGLSEQAEVHVCLDNDDFTIFLGYDDDGNGRLIGAIRDERVGKGELTFDDVGHRAADLVGLKVEAVRWFSTYKVHHRVTDRFRRGRAFLVGDAAHVHSPVGGQGMNTGILDAINLAWKLTAVLKGQAPDALLDSYEAERLAFAKRLVATTDRAFSFVTAEGALTEFLRARVAPAIASVAYNFEAFREFLFRTVSQTAFDYRASPLSEGEAGQIRGGDRLPFVATPDGDNFAPLKAIAWQVHLYGTAGETLRGWCAERGLPLHVFPWSEAHAHAGFGQHAAYLVRPDGYVGLADEAGSPDALARYLDAHGLSPA